MTLTEPKSARGICFDESRLPNEVRVLYPREREIATIVYALRAATAKDVAPYLCERLLNASLRSMLNRLVAKGILTHIRSGRAFVYLPALTSQDAGLVALRHFAEDHFGGSLSRAARTMDALTRRQDRSERAARCA
jgi:predicted transcriptional regulator